MEKYRIENTINTPYVLLDHNRHFLEFKGEARPEDVQLFFSPILEWLKDYEKYLFFVTDQMESELVISCYFGFDYFNSSSAKYIMDIIIKLKQMNKIKGIKLDIKWIHDEMDEDLEDAGKEFEDMLGVHFEFITN